MNDNLNDKKLLNNLLKAVKELTEVLKKTDPTKNTQNYNLEEIVSKRIQIKHDNAITSPMVGTVYMSPEPKAKAFIKTSSFPTTAEIDLSNMYFNKIGNEKGYQHYKEVLNLLRLNDFRELKKVCDYKANVRCIISTN